MVGVLPCDNRRKAERGNWAAQGSSDFFHRGMEQMGWEWGCSKFSASLCN